MGNAILNIKNWSEMKAVKLDPNDPKVKEIIESTIKAQNEILEQKNRPFVNLLITI